MRFLVEVHHPAHIHFFKYAVKEWCARGDEVLVLGRDRDVMRSLLRAYDWMPSMTLTREGRGNRFPLLEMLARQARVLEKCVRFKPDIVVSLMGSYTQLSRLVRAPNIIFTDSELQSFNHRIAHPFATRIYTPDCFWKDFGAKHHRYAGYHELAFLHPKRFTPDSSVLEPLGVTPRKYVVLRLSAFNTLHDIGKSGVGQLLGDYVKKLQNKYRVLLVPEKGRVAPEWEHLLLKADPSAFHDVLAHARFVVSEGASTAAECAMLGVPVMYINPTVHGYSRDLERRGLMAISTTPEPALAQLEEWFETEDLGEETRRRRDEMLNEKVDVTEFVVKELDSLR